MIRLVQKSDIEELAKIYKELYDNADIGENWTVERAIDLLMYWYERQQDLFFVDIEDNIPVGAIVSGVKSWFDGFVWLIRKYLYRISVKKNILVGV